MPETTDHPAHYEAWGLGFHLGNAVKYICRAGKKRSPDADAITDLEKARWYLDRHIANLKAANA